VVDECACKVGKEGIRGNTRLQQWCSAIVLQAFAVACLGCYTSSVARGGCKVLEQDAARAVHRYPGSQLLSTAVSSEN
jgi:hypothetical protein